MREALIPATVGILGTLLGVGITILATSSMESARQLEVQKAEAISAYLESAWGGYGESPDEILDLTRKLSLLTVFAPEEVLDAISAYQQFGCPPQTGETERCKILWANVVNELREMMGLEEVPPDLVSKFLWGEPGD